MKFFTWTAIVLFVIVATAGVRFQFFYAGVEAQATRVASAGLLQALHLALGVACGLATFFVLRKHPNATPGVLYFGAFLLLGAALAFGPVHHGLPYFVIGALRIHATEGFSLLAIACVAALLVRKRDSVEGFAAFIPVMVLSSVGGITAAWSYWLALAGVWTLVILDRKDAALLARRKPPPGGIFWNLLSLAPALAVAALPIVRSVWMRPVSAGGAAVAAGEPLSIGGWVVSDPARGAQAHTEFVLGAIGELMGPQAVVALLISYAALILCVLTLSLRASPGLVRYLGVAWALHTVGQVGWLLAASRALVLVPASGVVLPLVSFSGTFTLLSSAILTVLFAQGLASREAVTIGYESSRTLTSG